MARKRSTIDVVVRNDFHNTKYVLRTRWYKPITKGQLYLCRKTLCGNPACICGGILGQSGPQEFEVLDGFDVHGNQIITLEPSRRRG